jgi:hypothetical protein
MATKGREDDISTTMFPQVRTRERDRTCSKNELNVKENKKTKKEDWRFNIEMLAKEDEMKNEAECRDDKFELGELNRQRASERAREKARRRERRNKRRTTRSHDWKGCVVSNGLNHCPPAEVEGQVEGADKGKGSPFESETCANQLV